MARLRFETDLGTSLKASSDLNKAYDKLGDTLQVTAKEAKKLESAAARIVSQNLGPQEKYNAQVAKLAVQVKAGKLSMEEAEKATARFRGTMERAGQSQEKSFGVSAIDKLASYAAGLFTIQTAVGAISSAFTEMSARGKAAADRVFNELSAFGQLQQVATSPEDYLKLIGQARGAVRRGVFGVDQGAMAADFVFALRNAGYSDQDIEFITQIGETKKVKSEDMQKVAEGVKKYQNIFGKGEAGNVKAVAQKVFSAAGTMMTDFAKAAESATLFGSEASGLKFSDEEALAAFVAIEQQSPGPEEAATRLRSMLTQITKGKLSKGTMKATVESLVDRVRKGESAIDIVKETRAAAGLNILAKPETYAVFQKQIGEISAAQNEDLIGSRSFIEADPILREALKTGKAKGELAATEEAIRSQAVLRLEGRNVRRQKRITEQGVGMELFAGFMDSLFGWIDQPLLESKFKREIAAEQQQEQLQIMREQRNSLKKIEPKPPKPSGVQE